MNSRMTAAVVALTALFAVFLAAPAEAADKQVRVYAPGQSGENWIGFGEWKEKPNKLCVALGYGANHIKSVVRIRPLDRVGPRFSISTSLSIAEGGYRCTKSLTLKENERYRMRIAVTEYSGNVYSVASTFHT